MQTVEDIRALAELVDCSRKTAENLCRWKRRKIEQEKDLFKTVEHLL